MRKLITLLLIGLIVSCNSNKNDINPVKNDPEVISERITDTVYLEKEEANYDAQDEFMLNESLPEWFYESDFRAEIELKNEYKLDYRLNPFYLEADFNGDGNIDIAIPIIEIKTDKKGFAIFHGQTSEMHVIGAGTKIKNGLADDMNYIDIWKINRNKVNEAGLEENTGTGKKGELILKNPSLELTKSESGGGQYYWNGNEYVYFHQSC